jgi:hypothetical protein
MSLPNDDIECASYSAWDICNAFEDVYCAKNAERKSSYTALNRSAALKPPAAPRLAFEPVGKRRTAAKGQYAMGRPASVAVVSN